MVEVLLVSLMVFAAFMGALGLSEWAARHWVRTALQRQRPLGEEYPPGDPFEQHEL